MTAAEAAIRAKLARGEAITPMDHLATITDSDELAGFKAALTMTGRMTQDILTAIYRREIKIGRDHSR